MARLDPYTDADPMFLAVLMDGTLHITQFSQVYTVACECISSLDIQHRSNPHFREALKAAGPKPGGFQCMLDKESADTLFHELTFSGRVLWASGDE